jgi:hypothetical protein
MVDFVNRHMLAILIIFAVVIIGGGSFLDGYLDRQEELRNEANIQYDSHE